MKPLPDADQAAAVGRHRHARAGRRRCASAPTRHGAGRRRRGGGDGRLRAGRRLPREVRRRPHRRRARGGRRLRGSGSGGGGAEARPRLRRLHGRGQDDARRARRPPRSASRAVDTDALLEAELGEPIEAFFDREGEAAFRAVEEELVRPRCSRRPTAARSRWAAARCGSERVAGGAARATRRRWSRSTSTPRGSAPARSGRPLARDRAAFEALFDAARAGLRRRRRRGPARPTGAGVVARAARRAAGHRPRATACCGPRAASGDYPVWVGPLRARAVAGGRAALRGQRRDGGRPARRARPGAGRRHGDRARRGAQDAADGRARVARARRAGRHARRPRRRARRRRRRRPRGLLRGDLPARDPRRAGADDARRAGRLRLRRQDRRRPARRPRTTSAPTTSPRPCWPIRPSLDTLPPEELAAGYAEVLKTALIAGGALWDARRGRRPRRRRRDPRLRAHEAARRRRRRARRRRAARCSTSVTPSATRSRR